MGMEDTMKGANRKPDASKMIFMAAAIPWGLSGSLTRFKMTEPMNLALARLLLKHLD